MASIDITNLTSAYEGDEVVFRASYIVRINETERRIPMDFRIAGGVTLLIYGTYSKSGEGDLGIRFTGFVAGTGQPEFHGELRGSCPANDFKQKALTIGGVNPYAEPIPDSVNAYFSNRGLQIEFRADVTITPDIGEGSGGFLVGLPAL